MDNVLVFLAGLAAFWNFALLGELCISRGHRVPNWLQPMVFLLIIVCFAGLLAGLAAMVLAVVEPFIG